MRDADRIVIVDWVRNHHNVVNSPIARDTIICPDPTHDDPKRTVRKNKLLLQCPVRELHSDLHQPEIGLPHIVLKDGKSQLSDTVFRSILPFELRPMAKHLKQVCCCMICESMHFKQDALNQWRKEQKKDLKHTWEQLPEGPTRAQMTAKEQAHDKHLLCSHEAFCGDADLHPTSRDAVLSIQCDPADDFAGSVLTKLKCACGKCNDCPECVRPEAELNANHLIKFHCCQSLPTCSKCGALPAGTTTCSFCDSKKNKKSKGKLKTRTHHVVNQKTFQ